MAGILAVLVAAGKLPVWSPLVGILISAVPSIGFLMTRQAARGVFFVALVVAGLIILVLASNHAATRSASAGLALELLTAVVVALARLLHPLRSPRRSSSGPSSSPSCSSSPWPSCAPR